MAWLSDWAKRIKITVDHADIDNDLDYIPFLVYLSASSGNNSRDVSGVFDELTSDANRYKIAVTTSDGTTQTYCEIEKWVDADEKAWLWVQANLSSSTDTVLYLYYDSTKSDNTTYIGEPDTTAAANVWRQDGVDKFVIVDHMQDDPNTSSTRDSTYQNNDGAKKAANEPIEAATTLGDGQDFDGDADYISYTNTASLQYAPFTLEAVVEITSSPPSVAGYIMGKFDHTVGKGYAFWHYGGGGDSKFYIQHGASPASWAITAISTNAYTTPGIYYVAATNDGSTTRLFVDGVEVGTTVGGAMTPDTATALQVGRGRSQNNYTWNGAIDEVRVSVIARSATWIKASNESIIDDLVGFGTEEQIVEGSASASGIGLGTTDALLVKFATASASGIGSATAEGIRVLLGLASASGIGLGVGTGVLTRVGQALGSGVGLATATAILTVMAIASASGVGTGLATLHLGYRRIRYEVKRYPLKTYKLLQDKYGDRKWH